MEGGKRKTAVENPAARVRPREKAPQIAVWTRRGRSRAELVSGQVSSEVKFLSLTGWLARTLAFACRVLLMNDAAGGLEEAELSTRSRNISAK